MKKFQILLAAAIFTFCGAGTASAQAFLKGLADKAKDKVKEKVEAKVGAKIGKAIGAPKGAKDLAPVAPKPSPNAKTASSVTNSGSITTDIADDNEIYKWRSGEYFDLELANTVYIDGFEKEKRIKKSSLKFNSTLDMLNALPAVPTVRQILDFDYDNHSADNLIHYALAHDEYVQQQIQKGEEIGLKMATEGLKRSGATASSGSIMPASNALTDKMLEAIMKSGLNPETASEEEMMKVAISVISKEMGVPEAEMAKLMALAQTNPDAATAQLMKKYSTVAKKLGAIQKENAQFVQESDETLDKIVQLGEELGTMASDEEFNNVRIRGVKMHEELNTYANELLVQWTTSETLAKINAMEEELSAKTDAYLKAHNMNYNDEAPDFWVEGRKQQNALIDAFNEKLAEQWRTKIQENIDFLKPYAFRIADIEARYYQVMNEINDSKFAEYTNYLQITSGYISQFSFPILYMLPAIAMDAPRIGHRPEMWIP